MKQRPARDHVTVSIGQTRAKLAEERLQNLTIFPPPLLRLLLFCAAIQSLSGCSTIVAVEKIVLPSPVESIEGEVHRVDGDLILTWNADYGASVAGGCVPIPVFHNYIRQYGAVLLSPGTDRTGVSKPMHAPICDLQTEGNLARIQRTVFSQDDLESGVGESCRLTMFIPKDSSSVDYAAQFRLTDDQGNRQVLVELPKRRSLLAPGRWLMLGVAPVVDVAVTTVLFVGAPFYIVASQF